MKGFFLTFPLYTFCMARRRALLTIRDLHVSVAEKEVVHGLSLDMREGEVHAIMGPNGSGKSTLVHALMGHPSYAVTAGSIVFNGKNLLTMEPHERARAGLFLAFQYPREIKGVSLREFLFSASRAQMSARAPERKKISPIKFKAFLEEKMKLLALDPSFLERSVNEGFSGGEKKKAEVLQLHILEPRLALLDETDSGLDLDALKLVAKSMQILRSRREAGRPPFTALLVTHYARILDYLTPDFVHVMMKGEIVESGGFSLARQLEKHGYRRYGAAGRS